MLIKTVSSRIQTFQNIWLKSIYWLTGAAAGLVPGVAGVLHVHLRLPLDPGPGHRLPCPPGHGLLLLHGLHHGRLGTILHPQSERWATATDQSFWTAFIDTLTQSGAGYKKEKDIKCFMISYLSFLENKLVTLIFQYVGRVICAILCLRNTFFTCCTFGDMESLTRIHSGLRRTSTVGITLTGIRSTASLRARWRR